MQRKDFIMFEVHFVGNNDAEHGLYNYTAAGSKSQVIEGARIKSFQVPMLKYKQWLVLIKQGDTIVASRVVENGEIL
jgi:hypothetical protein